MIKKIFLPVVCLLVVACLNSCFWCTSYSTVCSCEYRPVAEKDASPRFYRVGDSYYVASPVQYVCEAKGFEYAASFGKSYRLPISYHNAREVKTCYVLMGAQVVQKVLGIKTSEPAQGTPALIQEDDWNAAVAQEVKPVVKGLKLQCFGADRIRVQYNDVADDNLWVIIPHEHGWDAIYKYPLAGVLFVGVDIPLSTICVLGGVIDEWVRYGIFNSMQQQEEIEEAVNDGAKSADKQR